MVYLKQDQHKVPQVYLKRFGYRDRNNQWKVSVMVKGETFMRQKSIESFTVETNIFNINIYSASVTTIFEDFNCSLENEYNNLLQQLTIETSLGDREQAYLFMIIANLLVRTDYFRRGLLDFLQSEHRERFLYDILGQDPNYHELLRLSPELTINVVLIYFMNFLLKGLPQFEMVFIKAQENKPWLTSTNPVVADFKVNELGFFNPEAEFYTPLSPNILVYLHHHQSRDKANPLRRLETGKIHVVDDINYEIVKERIIKNPSDEVIFPGECRGRFSVAS